MKRKIKVGISTFLAAMMLLPTVCSIKNNIMIGSNYEVYAEEVSKKENERNSKEEQKQKQEEQEQEEQRQEQEDNLSDKLRESEEIIEEFKKNKNEIGELFDNSEEVGNESKETAEFPEYQSENDKNFDEEELRN